MSGINYIVGDATRPIGGGTKIIAHCCNDAGLWGAGFVLALSRRWVEPELRYREWFLREGSRALPLGQVQFVKVDTDIIVANIIGQRGVGKSMNGTPPVRYQAIMDGFEQIAKTAKLDHASVHMPRIGCGLAGGDWQVVESLIKNTFGALNVPVFVYDLKSSPQPRMRHVPHTA